MIKTTRKHLDELYKSMDECPFKSVNSFELAEKVFKSIENTCIETDDLRTDIQIQFKKEHDKLIEQEKDDSKLKLETKKLEDKYLKKIRAVETEEIEVEVEKQDIKAIIEEIIITDGIKGRGKIKLMNELFN